jgi:hypothetical protein
MPSLGARVFLRTALNNCDGLSQIVERPRRGRVCRPAARVLVKALAGLLFRF